jgi:hypothetical protein
MSDNEEQLVRQYSVRIDTKPREFRWSGKAEGPLEAAALAFIRAMNHPEIGEDGLMDTPDYYSVAELDDAGVLRIVYSIAAKDAANAASKRIRYQRKLLKSAIDDYLS